MWLQGHPDQVAAQHVLKGLKEGFRIGFQYATNSWRPASSNMLSADTHPQVVSDYLQEEVEAGRIIGPLKQGSVVELQINPFGVIPKGHTPGKWRLIVDLSSPQGSSINDGILIEACSVTYITCDEVADKVGTMGRSTMMAKVDLKSAYRMVPVHPEDRKLLGMQWKDNVYIDTCLPFGLRSAPRIFIEVADMLEWCAKQQGVSHLMHYLDDYITWGRAGSLECEHNKACLINTCDQLGVLVAQEKCDDPATTITYLGIEIDSLAMELRLPEDKLRSIHGELGK